MKSKFFLLLALITFEVGFSQEANCVLKEKELTEALNLKDYTKATELVALLKTKCASFSETFYQTGIKVLQYNVDAANQDKKQIVANELIKFYDLYDKNFPNNKNGNELNKAILIFNTDPSKSSEIFTLLDKAFVKDKYSFTDPNILYQYFNLFVDKYKAKEVSFDALIEKYGEVNDVVSKNELQFPDRKVEYTNAKMALKSLAYYNFNSINIADYIEKNFDAQKDNVSWLYSSVNLLSEKNTNPPIFGKVAEQLYAIDKSSKSAYYLANVKLKNRDMVSALSLFEEAASLNIDKAEKASIYYNIAKIVSVSDKPKSKQNIKLAIANDESNGKFYIFLATLYANSVSECASSNEQRFAIYQLATQEVKKAALKDPRLQAAADQMIANYKKNNTPTQNDLDKIKKMGNKVKVDCWINETVQF